MDVRAVPSRGGKCHAVKCGVCGAVVALYRLREAQQVSALCHECREVVRRLKVGSA